MGWVTLDDNFPLHPKTVRAGKDAAYLYVCGICYCRRFHTKGFIPAAAVTTLGASTTPRKLVETLLSVQFWERTDGGFQVHGYAEMYPDDQSDKAKRDANIQKKREAGRKGGRASWLKRSGADAEAPAEAEPKHAASTSAEPLYRKGDGRVVASSILEREMRADDPPMDVWWREVLELYPQHMRRDNQRTQSAFVDQMRNYAGGPVAAWALFTANLELNKSSYQWLFKGMVPSLENYINGQWQNVLPADAPAAERVTSATAKTLAGAAEFLREGRRGA